ncbi:chemotaxis protein CheW [Geobacter sp. OR-1]|uniref:chemotaxis protein CheW n=1 Tax=Geobacter sp. OR-1 TaxID=1266765 RepID=UPI00054415A2|nr:chemotaxis protein CheW [Geobacter sp. OR-1]GAM08190.1 chemotaxis protein CheW [Geobacter sp. OR-1]
MNLAEIRKKANRDRDEAAATPAKGQPVVSAPPELKNECYEEQEPIRIDLGIEDEPEPEPVSESPENAAIEDVPFEVPEKVAEPAIPEPPQPIKAPAIPASTAMEYSASLNLPPGEFAKPDLSVAAPEPEEEPQEAQERHFDPLAILLSGRASSGFGDEQLALSDEHSEAEVADYQEFLCFRVCNEQYAINIMEIKEIIKPREITEVPRVPEFITGVLSLRGIIIPVFNMGKRLHLEPVAPSSKERIIVVSKGEELFGIQVDEVLQVVRIPEGGIEQPPAVLEGIDRDFVQGIGRHPSGMLILLNLESILDVSLF